MVKDAPISLKSNMTPEFLEQIGIPAGGKTAEAFCQGKPDVATFHMLRKSLLSERTEPNKRHAALQGFTVQSMQILAVACSREVYRPIQEAATHYLNRCKPRQVKAAQKEYDRLING